MTRAEQQLFLTQTVERVLHGRSVRTIPSEFLSQLECTAEYVVEKTATLGLEPDADCGRESCRFGFADARVRC
ncbi:MAG: hypothetical protein U0992_25070 [Planctomycetaceae bacterium]